MQKAQHAHFHEIMNHKYVFCKSYFEGFSLYIIGMEQDIITLFVRCLYNTWIASTVPFEVASSIPGLIIPSTSKLLCLGVESD